MEMYPKSHLKSKSRGSVECGYYAEGLQLGLSGDDASEWGRAHLRLDELDEIAASGRDWTPAQTAEHRALELRLDELRSWAARKERTRAVSSLLHNLSDPRAGSALERILFDAINAGDAA